MFSILSAVLLLSLTRGAFSTVLASSTLQKCVQDGSQVDGALTCQQQIVVTVTVPSGQALATDSLEFSLTCVNSADGVCPCTCNYLTDSGCTCRDLAEPAKVTLVKTPVYATYPMQYLQSFNYKPYETVIRPTNAVCKDGDYDTNPTCRWYYLGGQQVADSQGFTCECSVGQVFDTTFGGGTPQRTRANLDCDFFDDPLYLLIGRAPCSAHCLEFDPLWYSGYRLGAASLRFNITASITFGDSIATPTSGTNTAGTPSPPPPPPATATTTETLVISPSVPTAVSARRTISASLQGDLAMYTQMPVLSDQVLVVPQTKSLTPNRTRWLLLRSSQLSLDGGSCNMVGTSFSAFRYQASACKRAPQTCLNGQIKDLYESDLARIAAKKVPLYMLSQYTYGTSALLSNVAGSTGGVLSLSLPLASQSTSIVVIKASADSVRLVENSSPGRINNASVCTFDGVMCGGFEAGASRGYLAATVTNTGYIAASYTLTVANCSVNIQPVEARTLSLAPQELTVVEPAFEIYVEDSRQMDGRYCWVTLMNSQGIVTDKRQVFFFTNATVLDAIPTGGYSGNGTGVGVVKPYQGCDACKKVDVICLVLRKCWGSAGLMLGIIGGVLGAVVLLGLAAKFGLLSTIMGSLMKCCGCGGGAAASGGDDGSDDGAPARSGDSNKYNLTSPTGAANGGGDSAAPPGSKPPSTSAPAGGGGGGRAGSVAGEPRFGSVAPRPRMTTIGGTLIVVAGRSYSQTDAGGRDVRYGSTDQLLGNGSFYYITGCDGRMGSTPEVVAVNGRYYEIEPAGDGQDGRMRSLSQLQQVNVSDGSFAAAAGAQDGRDARMRSTAQLLASDSFRQSGDSSAQGVCPSGAMVALVMADGGTGQQQQQLRRTSLQHYPTAMIAPTAAYGDGHSPQTNFVPQRMPSYRAPAEAVMHRQMSHRPHQGVMERVVEWPALEHIRHSSRRPSSSRGFSNSPSLREPPRAAGAAAIGGSSGGGSSSGGSSASAVQHFSNPFYSSPTGDGSSRAPPGGSSRAPAVQDGRVSDPGVDAYATVHTSPGGPRRTKDWP